MMLNRKNISENIERVFVYFISFFAMSGFYAGIAIMIASGFLHQSRLFSVPIRLITSAMMLYVFLKNFKPITKKMQIPLLVFSLFWFLYYIKVFYCDAIMGYPLNRSGFEYVFYSVNFCVLPFLCFASIDFRKYKRLILNALILSGFVMACVCIYVYRDYLTLGLGRLSDVQYIDENAETLSPLALSYCGAITIILCFYKLFFESKELNIKTIIYLALTITASFLIWFLGSSRGSFLAIMVCLPLFFIYLPTKRKILFTALLIVILPVINAAIHLTGSSILDRVSSTVDSGDVTRGNLWRDAWNEFLDYPLLGNRIEIGFYPHNFILETLMATGIAGFMLLLCLLIPGIKRACQWSSVDKSYLIPFIVLLQGISQHSVTASLYTSVFIFLPLGIFYSVSKKENPLLSVSRK